MSQGRRSQPLPSNWRRGVRPRILKRDGYICQWPDEASPGGICGEPANEVDHKIPAHLGGPETDDNYWALCRWHHARKTAREASAVAHARAPRARPRPPHPGLLP